MNLFAFVVSFAMAVSAFALTVNVNTATQAQIEELPGVGPALAKKIIEARPLKSFEDLQKVKGLGSKADKMKDMVTFSGATSAAPAVAAAPAATATPAATVAKTPTTSAMPTTTLAADKKEKKSAPSELAPGQKVSLNSASKEELMKLKGIGEKKAELIIQNRPYKSVEDVMKLKGIKDGIFAKIKDNLTL